MESSEDVGRLSSAIEKLLAEKRRRDASGDTFFEDDDDQILLSRLLSQLELQKESEILKELKGPTQEESIDSPISIDKAEEESENPGELENQKEEQELSEVDMAKEIKELKRQNTITHVLLSAMIILTLTWQLSEFSVILKLKKGLSHPFRSFGGMLGGMLRKRASQINDQFPEKHRETSREQNHHNESSSVRSVNVPELLQEMAFNDEE